MSRSTRTVRDVILQPTTLCNWDCDYCYLPDRRHAQEMLPLVARSVADTLRHQASDEPVSVCWHGGEPLTLGVQRFSELVRHFGGLNVTHSVQTNASLVDERWCDLFAQHGFRVGVSLDGRDHDNRRRVDRVGRPTTGKALRGIERLTDAGFPISLIAVVSDPSPGRARRLYETAVDLGCVWLGVNIEETEGVNQRRTQVRFEQAVLFWAELADAWRKNPVLQLRDVGRVLAYAQQLLDHGSATAPPIDPAAHCGVERRRHTDLTGVGRILLT